MADVKFSCPHCQQHIAADAGYGGMQINCPACNGALTVPSAAPAPAAPPPQMRLQTSAPAETPPAAPPSPPGFGCPSCGAVMPRGAVLCTQCGYNTATRQRTVAGRPAALGKPQQNQWDSPPWYKTAIPYALGVLLLQGALFMLARENPVMMLVFVAVGALYAFAMNITAAVFAFKEGVLTGILTLCCFFYGIYYVFFVNENTNLKILYGAALPFVVALKFGAIGSS